MKRSLSVLATLALLAPAQAADKVVSFDGAWTYQWCGSVRGEVCGEFTLYLVQHGQRLCGRHFYGTINLSQIDEGDARSVTGNVTGNSADITIVSGRDGSVHRAHADRTGAEVLWRLRDGDGNDFLLLPRGRLTRASTADAELARVREECKTPD